MKYLEINVLLFTSGLPRSIKNFLILLILVPLFINSSFGQADSTKISSFWLVYKMGRSHAKVDKFKTWAMSEGLSNISSTSNNTFIGFDFLYHHNRMVYGINSDIELRNFNETEPYFFSFTFRAGYTALQRENFTIKTLGGIGVGYANIRFENGEPESIENLDANLSDPLARASMIVGRLEIMSSYTLGKFKSKNSNSGIYPLLYFNAGVTPTLSHNSWRYGEIILDIDEGGDFVGQPIDIPRFYKANWFVAIGFAVAIGQP